MNPIGWAALGGIVIYFVVIPVFNIVRAYWHDDHLHVED